MVDFLNTDLVALNERLNNFAKHYEAKGAQMAYDAIKAELVTKRRSYAIDGSNSGLLVHEGFELALSQVFEVLEKTFKIKK